MLSFKSSTPVVRLLLLLAVYLQAVLAGEIEIRQTTADASLLNCVTYSTVANLSTIGLNSTYRGAFLRSTPYGINKAAMILNGAQAQLPMMKFNEALNAQCGNSTAIAITEAANNFTNGIVAEFAIQPALGAAPSGNPGLITLAVVILIVVIMCGTFSTL
ncbi:hypothetical protein GQ53DRAFT_170273 [Thozetella sp. PMI_491]|nr:hypothetical protein GQ53DRAFT_170273 [Thozetella sp. PMI_491]